MNTSTKKTKITPDVVFVLFNLITVYSKVSKSFEYDLFFLDQFDDLPEFPGLYSWHLYCNPDNYPDFHSFHKEKKYKATIRGFLKESFVGELNSTDVKFDKTVNERELFRLASSLFSPPVYVGITKRTLKIRLNEHKRSLLKTISTIDNDLINQKINKKDIDTDYETKILSHRIANALCKRSKILNESFLFVKVIPINRKYDVESLENIETILNRTYNPIFGRK